MSHNRQLQDIEKELRELKNHPIYRKKNLTFNIIAGITMIAALRCCSYASDIYDMHKVYTKNVIENDAPEKFYEINGERVYLEIDGKSVDEYFK